VDGLSITYVLQALHYCKYSAASDIWSFGVLMYEIWSLGHSPFKQQSRVGIALDCVGCIFLTAEIHTADWYRSS